MHLTATYRRTELPDAQVSPAHGARADVLQVDGLWKTYTRDDRSVLALADVSMRVVADSITCILGGSGSGKSTLLRIIAGLDKDHTGTVLLNGQPIRESGLDRGMVFQDHRLVPWLSVERNVGLGLHRMSAEDRSRAIAEALELVDLPSFKDAFPSELSGGMAQRVAIARALAYKPAVLLLDEPFAALDALTKMKMQDELLRICAAQRVTAIMITHDVEEALYLGDQVIVLSGHPGRVKTIMALDLPRPRRRASPDFVTLRQSIYDSFFESEREP